MSSTGRALEYTDGIDTYEGYAVAPAGAAGRGPGLLVAHDWAGLHDGMKRIAERIAALGYTCLAMDVYGKGRRGTLGADNSALMMPVVSDRARLRQRLLSGLAAIRTLPTVDAGRIGVLGYCFGGLCALDLARGPLHLPARPHIPRRCRCRRCTPVRGRSNSCVAPCGDCRNIRIVRQAVGVRMRA